MARRSIVSIAASLRRRATSASSQRRSRPAGEREDAAVVDGVGVGVEQRRAAPRRRPEARRSARRRDPRRRSARRAVAVHPAQTSSSPRARSARRRPDRGLHHDAVEVDRDLDLAADRRRGAEGDVGGAEDLLVLEHVAGQLAFSLVPIPSSATLVPPRRARQQLEQRLPLGRRRAGRCPLADRQLDRLVGQADAGDRAVDDERPLAVPSSGAMNPSPQGRFPKRPVGEIPGVGDRGAALQPEPEVAAVRAGDARLGAARQQARRPPRPSPQLLHVGAHHAGEHLLGHPRAASRSARRPRSRALRAAVCESDCTVGASTTSAATIAAATVAGGSAACESRSVITASTASAPAPGPRSASRPGSWWRGCRRPGPPRPPGRQGSRGRLLAPPCPVPRPRVEGY